MSNVGYIGLEVQLHGLSTEAEVSSVERRVTLLLKQYYGLPPQDIEVSVVEHTANLKCDRHEDHVTRKRE